MSFLGVVIAFLFSNNLVFHHALGTRTLHEGPLSWRSLGAWGLFTTVFLVGASLLVWLGKTFVLVPWKLEILLTLLSVLVLLGLLEGYRRLRGQTRGHWPPARLLLANTALLGGVFLVTAQASTWYEAGILALAGGLGFFLALLIIRSLQTRWSQERLPTPFQGFPLQMIAAGLVALALAGLDTIFVKVGGL